MDCKVLGQLLEGNMVGHLNKQEVVVDMKLVFHKHLEFAYHLRVGALEIFRYLSMVHNQRVHIQLRLGIAQGPLDKAVDLDRVEESIHDYKGDYNQFQAKRLQTQDIHLEDNLLLLQDKQVDDSLVLPLVEVVRWVDTRPQKAAYYTNHCRLHYDLGKIAQLGTGLDWVDNVDQGTFVVEAKVVGVDHNNHLYHLGTDCHTPVDTYSLDSCFGLDLGMSPFLADCSNNHLDLHYLALMGNQPLA